VNYRTFARPRHARDGHEHLAAHGDADAKDYCERYPFFWTQVVTVSNFLVIRDWGNAKALEEELMQIVVVATGASRGLAKLIQILVL
jgi:hypothetical protein